MQAWPPLMRPLSIDIPALIARSRRDAELDEPEWPSEDDSHVWEEGEDLGHVAEDKAETELMDDESS